MHRTRPAIERLGRSRDQLDVRVSLRTSLPQLTRLCSFLAYIPVNFLFGVVVLCFHLSLSPLPPFFHFLSFILSLHRFLPRLILSSFVPLLQLLPSFLTHLLLSEPSILFLPSPHLHSISLPIPRSSQSLIFFLHIFYSCSLALLSSCLSGLPRVYDVSTSCVHGCPTFKTMALALCFVIHGQVLCMPQQ